MVNLPAESDNFAAKHSRHVRFPTYDGKESVDGFLALFEDACDGIDAPPSKRRLLLGL